MGEAKHRLWLNETDVCSLVALNFYACKMEDLEHTVEMVGSQVDAVKQRYTYTKGAINRVRIKRDEFRENVKAWDKQNCP